LLPFRQFNKNVALRLSEHGDVNETQLRERRGPQIARPPLLVATMFRRIPYERLREMVLGNLWELVTEKINC